MGAKNRNISLQQRVARLLYVLTPPLHREFLLGDWTERDRPGEHLSFAVRTIAATFRGQIREAFDPRLLAGEASVLCIAFAGAPLAPLAALICGVLAMFRLRDGYSYPAGGSSREAAADALAGAAFIVLPQALLALAAPPLALPPEIAARGTVSGIAMLAGWRMAFRMRNLITDPHRKQLENAYNETWQINILWMIAGMVLVASNLLSAVPATSAWRDFILTILPIVSFSLAHGSQAKSKIPLGKSVPYVSLNLAWKPDNDELRRKQAMLFQRMPPVSEALPFLTIALPFFIAFRSWFSADPSADSIDWDQVWINIAAFVALSALWIQIRRINEKTALSLENQIRRFDGQE